MISLTATALVLATLVQITPPGPVGPVIPVHTPLGGVGYAVIQGTTYADGADRYVSVCTDSAGLALKTVSINPSTGAATSPVSLAPSAVHPAIAWNSSTQRGLVVYATNIINGHVLGIVVDSAGAPIGGASPFIITTDETPADTNWEMQVASSGGDWLVIWNYWNAARNGTDIRGRVVDGTSTTSAPVFQTAPVTITSPPVGQSDWLPDVAFGAGSDFMVVWVRDIGGVFGRTVSPAGALGLERNYFPWGTSYGRVTANPATGEFLVASTRELGGNLDPMIMQTDPSGDTTGKNSIVVDNDPSQAVVEGTVSAVYNAAARQYLVTWMDSTGGVVALRGARVNGRDLTLLQTAVAVGPTNLKGGCGEAVLASRTVDTQVLIQWGNDSGPMGQPARLDAQRYDLGTNPTLPLLVAPDQLRFDGEVSIAAGDPTNQAGVLVRATISDPQDNPVKLDLEFKEVGTAFNGLSLVPGTLVPSGTTVETWVPLARNKSYHWRAKVVDSGNDDSDWVGFTGDDMAVADVIVLDNQLPAGFSYDQVRPDGSAVAPGHGLSSGIRFRSPFSDADGDDCRIEVEVRPIGTAFQDLPTYLGAWSAAGKLQIDAVMPEGPYHWQARLMDSALDPSAWLAFGGNSERAADFSILPVGSSNGVKGMCQASASRPASGLMVTLILALAVLRRRQ